MAEVAARFLPWAKDRLGASDVVTWFLDGRVPAFGIIGDALRLERRFLLQQMLPNRDYFLDASMQKALGLDTRVTGHGWQASIEGGVGQTMSTPDAHISEVMDGLQSALRSVLGLDDDAALHVAILPSEGAPWNPGDAVTPWFSAKKARIFETPPPPGLVEVEVRDPSSSDYIRRPGIDPCVIAEPLVDACGTGRALAAFRDGTPFLVAHSFSLERGGRGTDDELAHRIAACGGLLYPSLSVGPIAASNFGECSLVVDPGVVLAGLKPYRTGRGRWLVVVYSTDTWTESGPSFLAQIAADLFDQLTGRWTPGIYGVPHLYVLGPQVSEGGPAEGRLLDSTTKLRTELRRRSRMWPRDADPDKVRTRAAAGPQEGWYPYLEAKCSGILPLSCIPLAVAPASSIRRYDAFLHAAGFEGDLVALDVPAALVESIRTKMDMADVFAYGWAVADAVAAWASGRILEVTA